MSQVRALLGAPSAMATGARAAHGHPADFAKEDRGERIRISDLLRPRQARYQAALRPARSDGGVYRDFLPARKAPRSTREGFERRAQPVEGAPAVAQAVLLERGKLGERPPGRLHRKEEWVVAETVRSPRSGGDASVDSALGAEDPAVGSA